MGDNTHIVGRPKRDMNSLPVNWKAEVLKIYSSGASDSEIRLFLGVSQDLWERWLKEEPEFSVTIKDGREAAKIWWERLSRDQASGKVQGNATTLIFNMKNRFKDEYGDMTRHEVTGKNGGPIKREITFKFED